MREDDRLTSDPLALLLLLGVGVRAQELGEGSVSAEQLRVRARLRDLSVLHHQDEVDLRQEAEPVGHQHTRLRRTNSSVTAKFTRSVHLQITCKC